MPRHLITIFLTTIPLAVVLGAVSAATLQQVPPAGTLSPGETVLVDDGSCPAGQIKQVIGGNNSEGQPRQIKCIDQTGDQIGRTNQNINRDIVSQRFAIGGQKSTFGRFYFLNLDCTPMRQNVKISKSPVNGEARLQETTTIASFSAGNARARCNGKSTKATALEYTPTKGYMGKDSIEVEQINEEGQRNTYSFDITVK
jgi:hypothetical protein